MDALVKYANNRKCQDQERRGMTAQGGTGAGSYQRPATNRWHTVAALRALRREGERIDESYGL